MFGKNATITDWENKHTILIGSQISIYNFTSDVKQNIREGDLEKKRSLLHVCKRM